MTQKKKPQEKPSLMGTRQPAGVRVHLVGTMKPDGNVTLDNGVDISGLGMIGSLWVPYDPDEFEPVDAWIDHRGEVFTQEDIGDARLYVRKPKHHHQWEVVMIESSDTPVAVTCVGCPARRSVS